MAVTMCTALVCTAPVLTYATEINDGAEVSSEANESDFVIEDGVLVKYVGNASEVVIPDGVEYISEEAFASCTNVSKITFPSSIDSFRFSYSYYDINIFADCSDDLTICFEYQVDLYEYRSELLDYVKRFEINYDVIDADENGFVIKNNSYPIYDDDYENVIDFYEKIELVTYVGNAEVVTIPEGVEGIADDAFSGNETIKEVIVPSGVKNIGTAAFSHCSELKKVTLSEGLETIANDAFWNCDKLEEINIPNTVTDIDAYAFHGCHSLKSIKIPEGITDISTEVFYSCGSLTEIQLPNTIEEIGYNAFAGCKSLKEIVIPDSVTVIGSGAFSYCTQLEKIVIPESVIYFEYTDFEEGIFDESSNVTIYGVKGSNAEKYANANNIPFVALEDDTTPPDDNPGNEDDITPPDDNTGNEDDTTVPDDNEEDNNNNNDTDQIPNTGDSSNIVISLIMLLSGMGIMSCGIIKNKKIVR